MVMAVIITHSVTICSLKATVVATAHRMTVPNTHLTAVEMADLSSHKTLSAALFRLQQSPGFFKPAIYHINNEET